MNLLTALKLMLASSREDIMRAFRDEFNMAVDWRGLAVVHPSVEACRRCNKCQLERCILRYRLNEEPLN